MAALGLMSRRDRADKEDRGGGGSRLGQGLWPHPGDRGSFLRGFGGLGLSRHTVGCGCRRGRGPEDQSHLGLGLLRRVGWTGQEDLELREVDRVRLSMVKAMGVRCTQIQSQAHGHTAGRRAQSLRLPLGRGGAGDKAVAPCCIRDGGGSRGLPWLSSGCFFIQGLCGSWHDGDRSGGGVSASGEGVSCAPAPRQGWH